MPVINSMSVSDAWLRAVSAAAESKSKELVPLEVVIEVRKAQPEGNPTVRASLNSLLEQEGHLSVESVSNLIFPQSLWNPARSRNQLYTRYQRILPKLRKGRRGTYFERFISYPGKRDVKGLNQLEHVITAYKSGTHRRSALQLGVLAPEADHSRARQQGFPCLHQVGLVPDSRQSSLTLVGFYPLQYLFEKGYGNYLGLLRLGVFLAHEMELTLHQIVCVAGVAKLEVPLNRIQPLLSAVRK